MSRRAGVFIVLGLVARAPEIVGQTLFQWPEPDTSFARYTTFEECQALVWRMRDAALVQERLATGIAWDTMPNERQQMTMRSRSNNIPDPTSLAAMEKAAQRCLTRFANVDSVPLDRFDEYFEMYLHAGWDAKIQELVSRRVALAAPGDVAAVLDSIRQLGDGFGFTRWGLGHGRWWGNVSQWYGQARWDTLFEAMLAQHAAKVPDPVQRVLLYTTLLHRWKGGPVSFGDSWGQAPPLEDSAYAVRVAQRIVRLIDSTLVTPAQREALADSLRGEWLGLKKGEALEQWMHDITDLDRIRIRFKTGRDLDSLRKSTAAYLAGWHDLIPVPMKGKTREGKDTVLKETFTDLISIIGQHAPPVHADAWAWGDRDSTRPRPTPGRISLLVFFDGEAGSPCFTGGWAPGPPTTAPALRRNCAAEIIALRRLADRFPALEITVVVPARGYFKYLKPTTPAQEAELYRQLFASYGLQVPVGAMNLVPHWLPEPDGRRVDQPDSADVNWANYLKHNDPEIARILSEGKRSEGAVGNLYGAKIVLVDEDGVVISEGHIGGLGPFTNDAMSTMTRRIEVLLTRHGSKP